MSAISAGPSGVDPSRSRISALDEHRDAHWRPLR
jgi:hypothetical protein